MMEIKEIKSKSAKGDDDDDVNKVFYDPCLGKALVIIDICK